MYVYAGKIENIGDHKEENIGDHKEENKEL